jgi:pyruvate, orthophosphate dikinase
MPSDEAVSGEAASAGHILAAGVGVSPGEGIGELHVDVDDALDAIDAGRPVVIALESASPGDVVVIARAAGVMTVIGGPESHVAVVARGAAVPAVVGLEELTISRQGIQIFGETVAVGETVVVDGTRGEIRSTRPEAARGGAAPM